MFESPLNILTFLLCLITTGAQKEIEVGWFIPNGDEHNPRGFSAGDSVSFVWTNFHNVYIHPTGDCSQDGRTLVGSESPAVYTFTEADEAKGEVTFACDVGFHCEAGQKITFLAESSEGFALKETPAPSSQPSDLPVILSSEPETIVIDWFMPGLGNFIEGVNAKAGDTIEFDWSGFHNVYIHPNGDCGTADRILVGNRSGAKYVITEEDVAKGELVFACDVSIHCEYGQIVTVTLFSAPDDTQEVAVAATAPPTALRTRPPTKSPTTSPNIQEPVLPVSVSETIEVDWFIPGTDSLPAQTARVGDKVLFTWDSVHNVYIHPTGDCETDDSIFVGDVSPATYEFTEEDAAKGEVVFACDISIHCEFGQIITFAVTPPTGSMMEAPTSFPISFPTLSPIISPSSLPSMMPVITSRVPETVDVNWFIPGGDNLPTQAAKVGDTIKFSWTGFHNVYVHPTGDCSLNGRTFVGSSSPSNYVITQEDAENGEVVFACDISIHCEFGQIVTILVTE